MASLTLKDVPEDLLSRLRSLAEYENRSLDEEVLHLLLKAIERVGSSSQDAIEREAQAQAAAWREVQVRFRADLLEDLVDSRTRGRPSGP